VKVITDVTSAMCM